jgi:6-phosphogluconolactonase
MTAALTVEVHPDAEAVSRRGAAWIAQAAGHAIRQRGCAVLAFSGGVSPLPTFRRLADETVDWRAVHVTQVDERAAPAGSSARNLTHLREALLSRVGLPAAHIHPMPVEDEDLDAAAVRFGERLVHIAGAPPLLDLIQLGLGTDGHTASLVPGDPALDVDGADVAVTAPYNGHRRMTLTFPALNRARRILWLVTGEDKAEALARLVRGDFSIPAGRVSRGQAMLLADRAAAAHLDAHP